MLPVLAARAGGGGRWLLVFGTGGTGGRMVGTQDDAADKGSGLRVMGGDLGDDTDDCTRAEDGGADRGACCLLTVPS